MPVGYMPFLHHILVSDYGYTRKEIMAEIGGSKPYISNSLNRAKEKLENPMKLVQYNLFLQKIEVAFKRQLLSIDKSMFNVREV
jgi:CRISPR/Cas system endoribonuclease Cas6 (RAMP superfamily)